MKNNFILISCAVLLSTQLISGLLVEEFFEKVLNPPTYKLTYFPIRARAEFIRFMFAAANQPFEDYRLDPATWPQLKQTFPFGQLPTLQLTKGAQTIELSQSQAIAKYLAAKFDFDGTNDLEEAIIDMYGAQLGDLFNAYNSLQNNQTELFSRVWPTNLQYFESRLIKNGNGFLVGNQLSWADIYLSQITEFLNNNKDSLLNIFPNIKALDNKVRALPGVADWLRRRPVTPV